MAEISSNPKKFIEDYGSISQAELLMWIVDENPSKTLRGKLRAIRDYLFHDSGKRDSNDNETELAWQSIIEKWGEISSETIIQFLENKFDGIDHLRKFEYAFLARCLSKDYINKNVIVDIGGGNSYSTVVPMLLRLPQSQILSVDVVNHRSVSQYGVKYIYGDSMNTNLPSESADFVSIISTLEHVGLGRWGDPLDIDGDLKTMDEIRRILRPGGYVVLTIPYGYPTVVFNLNRIYDAGRLSTVTKGFDVVVSEFSINGKACSQNEIEGKKAAKLIPGYYSEVPVLRQHPNAQGGALLLLRKR